MTEQNAKVRSGAHSVAVPMTGWRLSAVISFLLMFALSFESVPLPIQAQIVPLTSLLALLFLPVTALRMRKTPLFQVVMAFTIYTIFHSVIALFIDIVIRGDEVIRFTAWGRQVLALAAGLSVFMVLRRTLVDVSDQFVISSVVAGASPAIALALLNVLWGFSGSTIAGHVVTQVRATLIPLGFTAPSRASGLSLEPSHFAFYLAVIVVPVCFARLVTSKRHLPWIALLGLVMAVFVWTVSITGFVVLAVFVVAGMLFGPRRRVFAIATIVLVLLVGGFLILYPSNYAVWQLRSLLFSEWSLSITNRFYSTFGPFINSLSSYTLIGYGLGGTSTHFLEIVPAVAQEDIAVVSWEGMPNLRTLVGRILAESGLLGLVMFAGMVVLGLKELQHAHRVMADGLSKNLLGIARLTLFGIIVGATIGYGSFALPYLWIWLAWIDSRYILSRLR
ncbi:MAG: hypothetical protein QXT77_08945 [Candidatus Methanomethylicaceae archaeon]